MGDAIADDKEADVLLFCSESDECSKERLMIFLVGDASVLSDDDFIVFDAEFSSEFSSGSWSEFFGIDAKLDDCFWFIDADPRELFGDPFAWCEESVAFIVDESGVPSH